jgi:short-subunit dehydrogenase
MQKAIIVGATSGIGRQLAILLANNHYLVGATGRRQQNLEALQSEKPDHILISAFDITHTFEVSRRLDELSNRLGGLDLVIICSGVGDLNHSLDFAVEKKTIDVNITGFTEVADWAFNFFEKQQSGHLVGITSLAGLRGSRHAPAYYATKAFQINYLEGLRQKAKKSKLPVYVTDIRPGFVDTEMAKGEGMFWMASVKKAAGQIFEAIKSRKQVAYVTRRWRTIAALLKALPGRIYQHL